MGNRKCFKNKKIKYIYIIQQKAAGSLKKKKKQQQFGIQ